MNLKEQIVKLLISGKLDEAIDLLMEITKQSDEEIYDTLILLKSRLKNNESDYIKGIITRDEYLSAKTEISEHLLKLTSLFI